MPLPRWLKAFKPDPGFQPAARRAARERVTWTIGLFCIFLLVPIVFLVPRILEQVKIETFEQYYWRGNRIRSAAALQAQAIFKEAEEALAGCDPAGGDPSGCGRPAPAAPLPGLIALICAAPEGAPRLCRPVPGQAGATPDDQELGRLVREALHSSAARGRADQAWQAVLLDPERLLFYRSFPRSGTEPVGGMIIAGRPFFQALLEKPYQRSLLGLVAALRLNLHERPYLQFESYPEAARWLLPGGYTSAPAKVWLRPMTWGQQGMLLYSGDLPAPLEGFRLIFTAQRVPYGPREVLAAIDLGILFLALLIGAFAISRLWREQIELTEKQENFVSAVTHELKSPLTSIRLYSELLCQGWVEDPEKTASYHRFLLTESERLSRLIENVLKLSGLSRADEALILSPCPVQALFGRIREKAEAQAVAAGFQFESLVAADPEGPAGAAALNTNEDALTQIVVNLIDNAVKFSKEAPQRKITLELAYQAQHALIAVRDFGPGIPASQREKIFDLFYRPENELTRTTAGTGIGLALVEMLTAKLGGKITVAPADPGTKFTLCLPRPTGTSPAAGV